MSKIAIISDERVWACGTGRYLKILMDVLGDDCIGLRLHSSRKKKLDGRILNIHPDELQAHIADVEQLWLPAIQNKFWQQVGNSIIAHPTRKMAIHNMEIAANKYMKCNQMYESDIHFDLQLVHRQAMADIFSAKFDSCHNVPSVQAHICLPKEEEEAYSTVCWEDKQRLMISANRWSSCKRSNQAFLALASAQASDSRVEMWGVKSKGLEMSQFHMLEANPDIRKLWNEFVESRAVMGTYDSVIRSDFLRRAMMSLDFMIIPGNVGPGKNFYAEHAHPQFVTLEAVAHRVIPVMAKDTVASHFSKGYFLVDVPPNRKTDPRVGSAALGKWLAEKLKCISRDEWEAKTTYNWDILQEHNSWHRFAATIEECRSRMS